ncbi:MAG: hypothetical protein J7647_24210 [Cyanobacteria bacterium SBLK]|nr:hypothetical protein [Cyanobacteria bacterium SBLK]
MQVSLKPHILLLWLNEFILNDEYKQIERFQSLQTQFSMQKYAYFLNLFTSKILLSERRSL